MMVSMFVRDGSLDNFLPPVASLRSQFGPSRIQPFQIREQENQ
jgi:hypothetical protein